MTQSVCGPRAERRLRDRRRPSPRFSQRPLGWLRWGLGSRFLAAAQADGPRARFTKGFERKAVRWGRIRPHSTRRHAEGWGEAQISARQGRPGRAGGRSFEPSFDLIIWAGLSWPFPLVSVVKIPAAARAAQLVGKADKPVPKGNSGPALKHPV